MVLGFFKNKHLKAFLCRSQIFANKERHGDQWTHQMSQGLGCGNFFLKQYQKLVISHEALLSPSSVNGKIIAQLETHQEMAFQINWPEKKSII